MSDTQAHKIKNRLARIYGGGILAFTAILGSLTLLVGFLSRLDW